MPSRLRGGISFILVWRSSTSVPVRLTCKRRAGGKEELVFTFRTDALCRAPYHSGLRSMRHESVRRAVLTHTACHRAPLSVCPLNASSGRQPDEARMVLFLRYVGHDETVTSAVHVVDFYFRVILEQLAELGDVNIHATGVEIVVVHPDGFQR